MLQLKNIVKTYRTGDLTQDALQGVSISFRESEFVSILGQSGSGKTTMLNIIGGLDRYTSGDLVINGVSTKQYRDGDWDHYRNNSIGFVFQSYNLIPHQTVLANVELALTLAGISKRERRERAKEVLRKVGLSEHIHKRPNQMSGGQMQRVAIARALVNNPDILLADEPTGALDSETSVQIMELLKEIARDKLVIMVTHNPELAQQYSTRIIKLKDGKITDDSNPLNSEKLKADLNVVRLLQQMSGDKTVLMVSPTGAGTNSPAHIMQIKDGQIVRESSTDRPADEAERPAKRKRQKRRRSKMNFFTALSLSFNNLRTKKGRTILTSLAGSIGIIGIALILALSTGMNAYIEDIQKETMESYPVTISSETIDMSGMIGLQAEMIGEIQDENKKIDETKVHTNYEMMEVTEMLTSSIVENDLTEFKKYLDDPDSEIQQYLGENGVIYAYDVAFSVYSHDADGNFTDSAAEIDEDDGGAFPAPDAAMMMSMAGGGGVSDAPNFSELMPGADGITVSQVTTDSYDIVYGDWPEEYDEVVLVLDDENSISAEVMYQLGLITREQYDDAAEKIENGEEADPIDFDFEEVCEHTFYLVAACDHYTENEDGTFTLLEGTAMNEELILENALELEIAGIIRPKADSDTANIMTAVAYTSKLTDYVIEHSDESAVIKAQERSPSTNVLNGMKFEEPDDAGKIADAKAYLEGLSVSEKAYFYQLMMYYASSNAESEESSVVSESSAASESSKAAEIPEGYEVPDNMSEMPEGAAGMAAMPTDENSMAEALDAWLEGEPDEELLLSIYDEYIEGASFEDNMHTFGKVSYDAPSSISIYTDNFENKDFIAECIEDYNRTADENERITYTDYVAILTSSLTTIIDGISWLLIGFVGISLVVSCIMIGIITHISVMERTKEIGILRALGASKRNISQVFNAETFIIGCCSGILGIGVSLLAIIPINDLIEYLTNIENLNAQLPMSSSGILIALSIMITILGGLLPAKKAAKKDPVIALRTE